MLTALLSHFSFHVYFAFCPYDDPRARDGAANYLSDLWRYFPKTVALSHTMLCIFVYLFSALFFSPFRSIAQLSPIDRDRYVNWLLTSRWYFLRLVAYAVKGHALVAMFRDKSLREDCKMSVTSSKELSDAARS